ncbi:hypothetical protein HU200_026742 [Digitaria exilis]|uniref:Uncharacterized protein n=1 Tax=Digitaria exilis TaxID=1010633 RepID=A0A835BYQ2_9POAL|nr:hypothetical protein HU200_026742 [Digitaria exilis]
MALDIDSEPSTPTQSSYFSSCMASPAWLPPGVRRSPARFQLLARGDDATRGGRRAWRGLLRRLVRESKSICSNACRPPAFVARHCLWREGKNIFVSVQFMHRRSPATPCVQRGSALRSYAHWRLENVRPTGWASGPRLWCSVYFAFNGHPNASNETVPA